MNKQLPKEPEIPAGEKLKPVSILRSNLVLLFFLLLGCVLIFGKQILIPITFSILLAMLMSPLADYLERIRINRIFSTLISVLIIMCVIVSIGWLVSRQFKALGEDIPEIEEKVKSHLSTLQNYIGYKFEISPEEQKTMLKSASKSLMQVGGASAKLVFSGISGVLGNLVLVFIFTFLLLFQREKYVRFILKLCKESDPEQAEKVLKKISKVSQHYLIGRVISIVFLFVLFSIGLSIAGTRHAILLSFLAALLTIVPYVGSIVGGILPFLMTLVTADSSSSAFIVLGVILFVQAIDNYFIEPNIVGGEVNLSALSTILVLIIGGYVWGIAGMILFIPLLGIAKIAFDHLEGLEPYGYLIGDQKQESPSKRIIEKIKALFKKR